MTYSMPTIEGNIADGIKHQGLSTIPSSGIFMRTALEDIGGFDESHQSSVDHDLWMSLAVKGYYALSVNEALTITYSRKQRKSMVTDTYSRIQGVEQYLDKWQQVFIDWYGERGAERYIKSYRTRILGDLAACKLIDNEWHKSWHVIKHILKSNGRDVSEFLRLNKIIARNGIRQFVPLFIISYIKDRKLV